MRNLLRLLTLLLLAAPAWPAPPPKSAGKPTPKAPPARLAAKEQADPTVISTGKEVILVDHLQPESATVVLFYQPAKQDDVDLAEELRRRARQERKLGLRLVQLSSLDAPVVKQYEIDAAPLAFVYDRNKNLVGRGRTLSEIGPMVAKALRIARIKWVDESDPDAPEVYRRFGEGKHPVPAILKTMSLEPGAMEAISELAQRYHFTNGFLPRRTKEMIASYVSALNKCKYWLGSHARFLQLQEGNDALVDALAEGKLDSPAISEKNRALLRYVEKLTLRQSQIRDTDVQGLRAAGWSDEEIFEATFTTALFAFFTRMADAYGLDYPQQGYLPPSDRLKPPQ